MYMGSSWSINKNCQKASVSKRKEGGKMGFLKFRVGMGGSCLVLIPPTPPSFPAFVFFVLGPFGYYDRLHLLL